MHWDETHPAGVWTHISRLIHRTFATSNRAGPQTVRPIATTYSSPILKSDRRGLEMVSRLGAYISIIHPDEISTETSMLTFLLTAASAARSTKDNPR